MLRRALAAACCAAALLVQTRAAAWAAGATDPAGRGTGQPARGRPGGTFRVAAP